MKQNYFESPYFLNFQCVINTHPGSVGTMMEKKGVSMTDLQQKYWALQETQRSNLANEAIRQSQAESQARQAVASMLQANAAQQQADVAKERAKYDRMRADAEILSSASGAAHTFLDDFTMTPKSQGQFYKDVGQGTEAGAGAFKNIVSSLFKFGNLGM